MFQLVKPSVQLQHISPIGLVEDAGRVCWKSESKKTEDSKYSFIKNIINLGHESVLEHSLISVKILTDRGVSHELVRHRIASYSQESTRYVNYNNRMFLYVIPLEFENLWEYREPINHFLGIGERIDWICDEIKCSDVERNFLHCLYHCSNSYKFMIDKGVKPQVARQVLPQALATTIVVSANFREWRHMFRLRYSNSRAHPHIRYVFGLILRELYACVDEKIVDLLFEDVTGIAEDDRIGLKIYKSIFCMPQEV